MTPRHFVLAFLRTLGWSRAKKATQAIRLVSQAGTGYFYTKRKNTKSNPEKLVLVKYDPRVNARVLFKEERIKK